eukprot:GHVQ01031081.1.p1 GENE.GHVQ01031081.1~~GHVQ01031081.1.p1  ORF type:complete len:749 (+),score=102.88 GHVQ01031081.1:551-2797(+)
MKYSDDDDVEIVGIKVSPSSKRRALLKQTHNSKDEQAAVPVSVAIITCVNSTRDDSWTACSLSRFSSRDGFDVTSPGCSIRSFENTDKTTAVSEAAITLPEKRKGEDKLLNHGTSSESTKHVASLSRVSSGPHNTAALVSHGWYRDRQLAQEGKSPIINSLRNRRTHFACQSTLSGSLPIDNTVKVSSLGTDSTPAVSTSGSPRLPGRVELYGVSQSKNSCGMLSRQDPVSVATRSNERRNENVVGSIVRHNVGINEEVTSGGSAEGGLQSHGVEEEDVRCSKPPPSEALMTTSNSRQGFSHAAVVSTVSSSCEDLRQKVSELLMQLKRMYGGRGDSWRANTFQKASNIVSRLPEPLNTRNYQLLLKTRRGIGKSVFETVEEIVLKGSCTRLAEGKSDSRLQCLEAFQDVWGVGFKTAVWLYDMKGLRSVNQLHNEQDKLLNESQKIGLKYIEEFKQKIPREEVQKIDELVRTTLEDSEFSDWFLEMTVCGSYVRGRPLCGDIDCLVIRRDSCSDTCAMRKLIDRLHQIGLLTDDLNRGRAANWWIPLPSGTTGDHQTEPPLSIRNASRSHSGTSSSSASSASSVKPSAKKSRSELGQNSGGGSDDSDNVDEGEEAYKSEGRSAHAGSVSRTYYGVCKLPGYPLHRRIDIKLYPKKWAPFATLYFTGSAHYNRSMRLWAKQMGYNLDDTGLYPCNRVNGQRIWMGDSVHCETEEDIFKALDLEYRSPEQRDLIDVQLAHLSSKTSVRT